MANNLLINYYKKPIDHYKKPIDNIIFYVITLGNDDRVANIKEQEEKYKIKLNIFNAVNGNNIDQNELEKINLLGSVFKFLDEKRSREIGCYLSHFNLLKLIESSQTKSKYTVILEDDFQIIDSNYKSIITNGLYQIKDSFDIIFLGYLNNIDETTNIKYSPNLYKLNSNNKIWGAYGYLVNNKSIAKIINLLVPIDKPIDIKYEELGIGNKLNIYFLNPKIIYVNNMLKSTIII